MHVLFTFNLQQFFLLFFLKAHNIWQCHALVIKLFLLVEMRKFQKWQKTNKSAKMPRTEHAMWNLRKHDIWMKKCWQLHVLKLGASSLPAIIMIPCNSHQARALYLYIVSPVVHVAFYVYCFVPMFAEGRKSRTFSQSVWYRQTSRLSQTVLCK